MKEHHRTDRLTAFTILFIIIIAVIMFTYRGPRLSYEISVDEMLSNLNNTEYLMSVEDVDQMNTDENLVFVDIRDKGKFFVDHIQGAVNISKHKLLSEETIEVFEEEKTYILYGSDHLSANGVWMLLNQLGFDNIKMLNGGYENYLNFKKGDEYYGALADITETKYDLNAQLDSLKNKIIAEEKAIIDEMGSQKSSPKAVVKKNNPKKPQVVLPVAEEEEEEEEEGC